ncbi:MAG: site-specific integrase [Rhodoferax sp.]|nr:site-specific integrase [Rhodoferax sp.]
MSTIRERIDATGKKSYHVQIRIKGFPPQTQSFDTKTVAKQWAAHVESELRNGRFMPRAEAQKHTFKELLEDYRDKVLIPTKPKELRTQGAQIDWWIEKLGSYSLADLTPAAIGKCRDELMQIPYGKNKDKKRSPATVVRYMALLSQAFNVAVREWQWLPESPMSRVSKPKVNNARQRYLTDDEHTRLLAAAKVSANRYLHTILITAISTGMRYGEIMNLRWRNITFDDQADLGLIMLETTKNGEPRGVPLVTQACVAIKTLHKEHAKKHRGHVKPDALLFPSEDDANKPVEIRKAWETTLGRAGIENFRFHDLRHTAASFLAMDGATAPEIAEILGHKSLQMVKRYSHLNKAHIAKVMTRVSQRRLDKKSAGETEQSGISGDERNAE